MAFLGAPAYTIMTLASSTWLPAATLYYVISGDGLVFDDNRTLLPGSILTTYSQQISLGTDGADLFFGTGPGLVSSPLASPAATGTDSASTTSPVTGTATATASLAPPTTSVTASISASATSAPSGNRQTTSSQSPTSQLSKGGLSASAKGGIGIGIAIAILLIAGGILIYIRRLKKALMAARVEPEQIKSELPATEKKRPEPVEADVTPYVAHELVVNEIPVELDG